jgi:hypothetical protein
MSDSTQDTRPLLRHGRVVSAQLIGGFWPGRDAEWAEQRLAALPPSRQVGAIGGVLAMLFLTSLFAAQFGLLGMALFLLAVILVVA